MRTTGGTYLTPTAIRRTALAELLLLFLLQFAPAFDLFRENAAFASGSDRLLPAAPEGATAAVYSREGTPESATLRAENGGIDAAPSPTGTTTPEELVAGPSPTADNEEPTFPRLGNDILCISPKHSPPRRG